MRVSVSRDQIKKAFDAVKHDPSFDESRALDAVGKLPAEMIQALCLRPEILRGFAGFGGSVYPGGLLERSVKELVIIEASRRNACQFCAQSHLALVKLIGLIDDPGWRVGLSAMLICPAIASLLKSGEPTMARISPVEGLIATSAPFFAFLSTSVASCSVTSRWASSCSVGSMVV